MCPDDLRRIESRPRRYQLSLISTAADVGLLMLIWHPSATNTGEPISTITDIDLARCGLIKPHLAYHRTFCRFGQALRHTIVHLTSNVACGGFRPPHPRSCGLCVPLRARLRPRPYGLRNDARALSSLVTLLRP